MKENRLGIAISIYKGCEPYIDELFESLVKTNAINDSIEVMIVDNASGLPEIWNKILEFSENKDWVRTKQFTDNIGKKQATWYSLNNLESKYVQVLDHDDFLIPENIEEVINILYSENPDISFLTYPYYSDRKKKIKSFRKVFKGKQKFKNVDKLPKHLWHFDTNTILNREYMLNNSFEFPENITRYEDVYINMWNLQNAKKVTLINIPIYMYRINVPNQLSSTGAMMRNFDFYKNTVFELSKLNFKDSDHKKNMKYIFSLNYLSYSYFNSISKDSRKVVRARFKELRLVMKRNNVKGGFIFFMTDLFTLRRKNYFLILVNKIVLLFRK